MADMTIDGVHYDRVFVSELEPGDVSVFGETVESVTRLTDLRTRVAFTNGQVTIYGNADSTALVESRG